MTTRRKSLFSGGLRLALKRSFLVSIPALLGYSLYVESQKNTKLNPDYAAAEQAVFDDRLLITADLLPKSVKEGTQPQNVDRSIIYFEVVSASPAHRTHSKADTMLARYSTYTKRLTVYVGNKTVETRRKRFNRIPRAQGDQYNQTAPARSAPAQSHKSQQRLQQKFSHTSKPAVQTQPQTQPAKRHRQQPQVYNKV